MGKWSQQKCWDRRYADLILLIKINTVIYSPWTPHLLLNGLKLSHSQYITLINYAWDNISKTLNIPCSTCKTRWSIIKSRYVKLKELISSGKVSKEIIESHPDTKFMLEDGILSFLDPYIDNVEYVYHAIPPSVHKYYDNLFHVNTLDQDPKNSSPGHENYNKGNKVIDRHKLGLESELTIEDDITSGVDDEDVKIIESPIEIIELNSNDNEVEHLLSQDPVVNVSSGPTGNITVPDNNIQDFVRVIIPATHVRNINQEVVVTYMYHIKDYVNALDQDPDKASPAYQNNDERNNAIERHKLGLESELIIEDDIKTETDDEDVEILNNPINNTVD